MQVRLKLADGDEIIGELVPATEYPQIEGFVLIQDPEIHYTYFNKRTIDFIEVI